jgi:hypothetical protein
MIGSERESWKESISLKPEMCFDVVALARKEDSPVNFGKSFA